MRIVKVSNIIKGTIWGLVGLLAAVFIVLQIALNSKVLTRIVNRIAAEYVDGSLDFSRVHASVFTSFPNLAVTLDDFALTYPHETFAVYDSLDSGEIARRRFSLLKAGRGSEGVDTLASFTRARVVLNYMSLISGRYDVRGVDLVKPRIFAHKFDSTAANWNIIKIAASKDTTSKPLPPIDIHRVRFVRRPFVVYTDPADTLFAMVTMKGIFLKGHVMTYDLPGSEASLLLDSAFVSGRLPSDTLAFAVERLKIDGGLSDVALEANGKAFLRTGRFGRMRIPVSIDGRGGYVADTVRVDTLNLRAATLGLGLSGRAAMGEKLWLDAMASIPELSLAETIDYFGDNFPAIKKLSTNAVVSARMNACGVYDSATGQMPDMSAFLRVPRSTFRYEGIDGTGKIEFDANASTDSLSAVNIDIIALKLKMYGAELGADGFILDALGGDPRLGLDGSLSARIDSLTSAFTSSRGISGQGRLTSSIHARALLSQLNMASIGKADIKADIKARNVEINDRQDTLTASIPVADISLETRPNKIDRNLKKGARVLGLKAAIDTLDVTYKENMFIRGGDILLLAQNSDKLLKGSDNLSAFMGYLKAGRLRLRDGDNLGVALRNTRETFRITPATEVTKTAKLALSSNSEMIFIRNSSFRSGLRNLKFDISAGKHVADPRMASKRRHLLDSLQRVYPGIPRDSLLRHHWRNRPLPSYLSESEFRAKDISLSFGDAVAGYVRDWDFTGNLSMERARLGFPSFPLKTLVSNVKGSVSNNEIKLSSLTVKSGESDLSGQATLTGLRRALTSSTGRGRLALKANITSDYINANELMRAYAYNRTYVPEGQVQDNDNYENIDVAPVDMEVPDSLASLIVIPSNLTANITLEANKISYDSLLVTWAAADIAMRQRTLQITNTVATSNMGDIYFEGFYSTRTKNELKAGFDLNLVDITAEKVITLFPQVDEVMPMLKTFSGYLDCEIAVTSDLDIRMDLVLPSIDGIMKISGKDLTLQDSPEFTRLAKLLMFKDKRKLTVDKMSVSGMIRNNVLEVFPFVLGVDRYTLAASGLQNLDKSFNYHLSVIKSPIPFKFGINVTGKDFDHIKYGVGKAKYKDTNVPVFTKELNAVQYNLLDNIHNIFEIGVEKAIAQNQAQNLIQDSKGRQHYDATEGTSELSAEESAQLQNAMKSSEDSK